MEEQASYLEPSQLLDYNHPDIQQLIMGKGWDTMKKKADLIGEVYTFVRDEIAYGYTRSFYLSASKILSKRYGNCLTKSILLMALLRAVGVPCRFHAMTISKVIYRGLLSKFSYKLAFKHPYHAWVEIEYNNTWLVMEGHIVDKPYILKLQEKFPDYMGSFYGYGIAVLNFKNPDNRWNEDHTYVQRQAIEKDLGIFDTPDAFFSQYPDADTRTYTIRYRLCLRKRLNRSIQALRNG